MVSSYDGNGNIQYVNDKFCAVYGYRKDELIGKNYNLISSGIHGDNFFYDLWQKISAGEMWRGEICNKAKDGTHYWTDTFIVPEKEDKPASITYHSFHVLIPGPSRKVKAEPNQTSEYSEELYHSLVDNLPVSIWRKDLDGRITFANKNLLHSMGLKEEDLLGKTNYDLYPKELADKYSANDAYVLNTGNSFTETEVITGASGEKTYVETVKIPIPGLYGKFSGIQGIFWDVTDRINSTEKIKQSERHFQKLVNRIHEVVFLTNAAGVASYSSDSVKDILGYTAEEIIKIPYTDIVNEADHELIKRLLEEVSEHPHVSKPIQIRVRRKDGEWRWVEAVVSNYIDDPDINAFVVNMRDIHHLKQAEENLKLQALLLQEVSEAIISTDLEFRILTWNKAAEELYGWEAGEVTGKIFREVIASEYERGSDEEVIQTIAGKGRWEGEVIQTTKSGQKYFFFSSITVVEKEDGTPIGFVAVNRNITERKLNEEKLKYQNERLTEIAWLHSHKIRGPVATIMGLMNIYDWTDPSSTENRGIVEKVDQVSRNLDNIIHDIVKKTGELHQESNN